MIRNNPDFGKTKRPATAARDAEKQSEEQKSAAAELQKGDENAKYDEEVQARAQQYRDIPEDAGGLLRAFIQKEYRKNRYKE